MKIVIDLNGVHRTEVEQLKQYLTGNYWKWKEYREVDND